ncbi:hypothetical protein Rleg2_6353 (plasmid) [Rhizobium leguminosarum bv. trifolii WSM2304]|uniref:Uncharacterized protein n=1 Tax=Rhizobium leguminosarum bv. trifolii (strain WSM2304) TaxID=395492 RepID=A0ABF7R069_RHILW|nr:hypothetical protein Rleg2_6353 [Rhizobium leguminosarum bv. trifolii WSM2304]
MPLKEHGNSPFMRVHIMNESKQLCRSALRTLDVGFLMGVYEKTETTRRCIGIDRFYWHGTAAVFEFSRRGPFQTQARRKPRLGLQEMVLILRGAAANRAISRRKLIESHSTTPSAPSCPPCQFPERQLGFEMDRGRKLELGDCLGRERDEFFGRVLQVPRIRLASDNHEISAKLHSQADLWRSPAARCGFSSA